MTASKQHNTRKTRTDTTQKLPGHLDTMAKRFIAARESVNLSASELAEQIGVHKGTVSRIEQGQTQALQGETLLNVERVTHHRGLWIVRGEGPRLVTEDPESLLAKQLAVQMTPDQLRRTIELSAEAFTTDDVKALVSVLLDSL